MPERANVQSVDAIDAFRARLVVYLSQARPALEEISADALRTRLWLENEQRTHLERQLARRRKELEAVQQVLFGAKLSSLGKESALDLMNVQRAKRAVEETEAKLRAVKKWSREFDTRVQPLLKQIEKLHTIFSSDMVHAIAYLTQTIQTLSAYSETQPAAVTGAGSVPAPSPVSNGETREGGPTTLKPL